MEVEVTGKLEVEQKGEAGKQENTVMQDELLKQLHEQYAVNNNANLGTIVTLVVAVIAVIGYFGYVYVHTGVEFSNDFGCLVKSCGEFYLDALLLIYLASVLVIAILIRLCIYQGVAQRKEQFIIHSIRRRYFGYDYLNQKKKDRIFPKDYHPYKKGKDIPQGLYGELVEIFKLIFLVLTCAVALKIIANICCYFDLNWNVSSYSILGAFEVVIVSILVIVLVRHSKKYYKARMHSYEKRKKEYYVKRKKKQQNKRKQNKPN